MIAILITGKYDPTYNRNLVLINGLKKRNDVTIIEFPYTKRSRENKLIIQALSKNADLVFLPSFTHLDVKFVKKSTALPVVFDPLISKYLSKVFDYKAVWKYSPRAFKNYLKDRRAFIHSDLIFADTYAHKEYYVKTFSISTDKIEVLPVGADKDKFYPISTNENPKFTVGFYGSFIPLHGIDKIIQAAELLNENIDIHIKIYGDGTLKPEMEKLAQKLHVKNLTFEGYIAYNQLNEIINSFDVCLGIFGDSLKTELVIPNKIYHYVACAKPFISWSTKGMSEAFKHLENSYLCENSPQSLAKAIMNLKNDVVLREKLAKQAYQTFVKGYDEVHIAQKFVTYILAHFPFLQKKA